MIMRLSLSLLLTLALAFTSLTMAQARGAAAATGQMVICSGLGTTIIYVDADGQPTQAPHMCPDCLMLLATEGAPAPLKMIPNVFHLPRTMQLSDHKTSPLTGLTPPSRAPPLTV